MKEVDIKINTEEARQLVMLLDIAVKSTGLQYAENALYFTNKIKQAFITDNININKK